MQNFLDKVEYYIEKYGLKAFEKFGWVAGLIICVVIAAIVGGAMWYFGG